MIFRRTKVTKGKNAGKWLLSFYCRNKEYIRQNDAKAIDEYGKKLPKGVRMKYISLYIEWTLRHLTENILEAHKVYIGRLEQKIAVDKQIAKCKLADVETELNKSRDEYSKHQNFQVSNPDAYKQYHKGKLEEYENLINVHASSKERLKVELGRLNDALPPRTIC